MTRGGSLATALAGAMLLTSCFSSHKAASVAPDDVNAVPVPAESLWDPNAAEDPVLTYQLRLATEPDNPALYNNLGNLYVQRNWMKPALEVYKKAIKLDPDSPIAWNNIGTAYLKMGDDGQAMDAFRKSVKIDDKYALGWYNMGVIYDEHGDYDSAIEYYLKAAALKPGILDVKDNPQVVNNRHLTVLRLRRYLEEEGGMALPLENMPE